MAPSAGLYHISVKLISQWSAIVMLLTAWNDSPAFVIRITKHLLICVRIKLLTQCFHTTAWIELIATLPNHLCNTYSYRHSIIITWTTGLHNLHKDDHYNCVHAQRHDTLQDTAVGVVHRTDNLKYIPVYGCNIQSQYGRACHGLTTQYTIISCL